MAGTKNSGRRDAETELKMRNFKKIAWNRIIEVCEKNTTKLDEYIVLFSGKLMPQQTEIGGLDGEKLQIELSLEQQKKIAQEFLLENESNKQLSDIEESRKIDAILPNSESQVSDQLASSDNSTSIGES